MEMSEEGVSECNNRFKIELALALRSTTYVCTKRSSVYAMWLHFCLYV